MDLVDQINNTPVSVLADSLHNRLDVNSALAMLAIDNFTVNLDSYVGRCANYYFYHRDLDDRFVFTKWDQNESWGIFNKYNLTVTQLQHLSPYWTNTLSRRGASAGHEALAGPGLRGRLPRPHEEADGRGGRSDHPDRPHDDAAEPDPSVRLRRPQHDVHDRQFRGLHDLERLRFSSGPPPGRTIPALQTFITARHSYLSGLIGTWTPDRWVWSSTRSWPATARRSPTKPATTTTGSRSRTPARPSIALGGLGLTDHLEGTPDFVFPTMTLAPGEYVIVWADEEPAEGALHAPFKLDADGEDIYLTDGAVIIDQVTFPALASNVSWGRWAERHRRLADAVAGHARSGEPESRGA